MVATSLDKIFPSKTFVDVLLFFILHPQEETYISRIVRATNKVLIQVQRTLKRLEEAGLVKKIRRGNRSYYQANAEHSIFNDLKRVLIKTVIFSDQFEKELSLIKDKIVYGFIFGSTATNTDDAWSDVDIFLVGNLSYEEAGHLSYPLSIALGREVNTIVYTLANFKKKIRDQHVFIKEVCESPKIWLFGDEREFKKICR